MSVVDLWVLSVCVWVGVVRYGQRQAVVEEVGGGGGGWLGLHWWQQWDDV